jgi:hypothetical protein
LTGKHRWLIADAVEDLAKEEDLLKEALFRKPVVPTL